MPIERIIIRNSRSLLDVDLSLTDINCLIGENGTGKTNILRCLDYFYANLTQNNVDVDLFDKDNPYIDLMEISLTYDMSKLIRIAKSKLERDPFAHSFFRKILYEIKKFLDDSNKIKVTLKQYKNGGIHWNVSHDFRAFLKNAYPIYLVQARHINLTDWENLWDIIGDMSKQKEKKPVNQEEELSNLYEKVYGDSYKKNLKYLLSELNGNDIVIEKFSTQEKFTHLYQLQFGGKDFKYKDRKLNYFSDGMNSNNYLKIFYSLVEKLTYSKLKEPTIVVDEPEVGLHPKLADELMKNIISKSKVVRTIIATHSSRMVKNIINSNRSRLFHISNNQKHTFITKMKPFVDSRETNIISEKEASYYFSRGILFVEGATELELFTNYHLKSLFPILDEIEVFSYDSDNVKLSLIHPKHRNTAIPHLLLLDMDKIMFYKNNQFHIKGDSYNPFKDAKIKEKELFLYGSKRFETLYQRKRIKGIVTKCQFSPDPEWFYLKDKMFNTLKNLIKEYCLEYSVYPVETTIEGTLVNKANHKIVYNWLRLYKNDTRIADLYEQDHSIYYRTTLLRLLVSGKLDTLNFLEQDMINNVQDKALKANYKKLNSLRIKKTDGWVGSLLDYYFNTQINANSSTAQILANFRVHFKELYDIIKNIENMMR